MLSVNRDKIQYMLNSLSVWINMKVKAFHQKKTGCQGNGVLRNNTKRKRGEEASMPLVEGFGGGDIPDNRLKVIGSRHLKVHNTRNTYKKYKHLHPVQIKSYGQGESLQHTAGQLDKHQNIGGGVKNCTPICIGMTI